MNGPDNLTWPIEDAPREIWMPPGWEVGDGTIPTDRQCEDDDIVYIRADLHEAAVAAARADMFDVYWRLRSYAVHDDACTFNRPPHYRGCSCGLTAALVKGEAALGAEASK